MDAAADLCLSDGEFGLEWWGQLLCACRMCFFFQAEDGIRDYKVTGVQTCALPISDKILYEAEVTATGGRDGKAASDDGLLSVSLSLPKSLGGPGGPGTNPEQLFAAGYAACFLGAVKLVARTRKITPSAEPTGTAKVCMGPV